MIFTGDPRDPAATSGLPYAAARALERRGCAIFPIETAPRAVAEPVQSRARAILRRVVPRALLQWPARRRLAKPGCVFGPALDAAERVSAALLAERRERPIDALFGMCTSAPLAFLDTDVPIVYASDATARVLFGTHPRYARRHHVYRGECDECERRALRRASYVALASKAAALSAVSDYGIDPARVDLVPVGCRIVPGADESTAIEPPSRDCLRILMVASDAESDQIRFALRVLDETRARGIDAELVHIGPSHRSLQRPHVRSLGALRIGVGREEDRHRDAIRSAHVTMTHARCEAFGMAAAEGALFGKPAIVSDVGGLSTLVRHDDTGVVLPSGADESSWADAVERLVHQPERYRRYAVAARARAWNDFTWDRWAERVHSLIERAVSERGHQAAGLRASA